MVRSRATATEKSQVATKRRQASEHRNGARQARSDDDSRAVSESLRLLEWPALCRQVAAFASISITARDIQRDGLLIGSSQVFTSLWLYSYTCYYCQYSYHQAHDGSIYFIYKDV